MPDYSITLRKGRRAADQEDKVHNRWHPDIKPIVEISPGDEIRLECIGYDDYQLKDTDSVEDVKKLDLSRVHPITGPIAVRGAQPGDFLVVEILNIEPLSGVGYSAIIPEIGGILKDIYPKPFKSAWHMKNGNKFAVSRHVPGVTVPAMPHPGVIGTAPSAALLREWHRRESPLYDEGKAYGPSPETALPSKPEIAKESARTVPARENWGNVDIKDLTLGSKLFIPVLVKGGHLSVGDLHFAQGDGEVTWNAIEMDGKITLRVGLWKGGHAKYRSTWPIYQPGWIKPQFSRVLTFAGLCVENGKQYYLDATIATRQALVNTISFLRKLGYTGPQAYTILSVCGMQMKIFGIVDVPNAGVGVDLPLDIFDKSRLAKVEDLLAYIR
jgi:formamidase